MLSRCLRLIGVLLWSFLFFFSSGNSYSIGKENKSTDDLIPDNIIALAEGEATNHVIIVEKASQHLMLYSYDGDYHIAMNFDCSTGEVAGAKTRAGDKKTPEGVYFFIQEHEKKYLSAVYGDRAYPMDYPNVIDRSNEYEGNSIWLHGTNKPIKPMNSNGCVVLDNKAINDLSPYISLNRTPIIVVEKITYVPADTNQVIKDRLVSYVRDWHKVMTAGSYQDYLAFYDPEYVPDISWWPAWRQVQKKMAASGTLLFINMHRPMILKDKDTYVVLFDQTANVGEKKLPVGTRKLFIANKNNGFVIIGDEFQPQSPEPKITKPDYPLVAAIYEKTPLFASLQVQKPMVSVDQDQRQLETAGKDLKASAVNGQDRKPPAAVDQEQKIPAVSGQEQKTAPVAGKEKKPPAAADQDRKPAAVPDKDRKPVALAGQDQKQRMEAKQEIAGLVEDWLKAWSSKDMDRYGSYYALGFQSDGMNLDAWLKHKRQLSKQYRYIKISKKDLAVAMGDQTTTASFVQVYESSGYNAVGKKQLFLKRENGKWKIFRETWKRM